MMKTVETIRTCDIDQASPATEVRFGYKGKAYRIDLCEECRAGFNRYWQAGDMIREPMKERNKSDK